MSPADCAGRASIEKRSLCAEVCIPSTILMQARHGSWEMSKTSEWHGDFRAGTFANEWIDAVRVCAWNIMGKDRIPSPEDHLSCCTCAPATIIKDAAALSTPASLVTTRVTKAEQLVLIVPQKGGRMLTVEMDTQRLTGSTNSPVN